MLRSPPSRRRGLKLMAHSFVLVVDYVASFAEAWIEITVPFHIFATNQVASFAEAWIEIICSSDMCHPNKVASFAEAWIEIKITKIFYSNCCRLLRGGVD